jgi:hypothetical protein
MWPLPCDGEPVRVVVLNGTYTFQELPSVANVVFTYTCSAGGNVSNVILQPMSDQANLTGYISCDAGGCRSANVGPYSLALNFTTSGYWDLQSLSKQGGGDSIVGDHDESPIPSTLFAPGVYTIAVGDEWGATVVLYLTVLPAA